MEILGVLGPFQIILMLVFGLLGLGFLVIWILALVDIVKNEFEGQNKLIWALVVALTGIIGAIIYFAIGTSQKLPKGKA